MKTFLPLLLLGVAACSRAPAEESHTLPAPVSTANARVSSSAAVPPVVAPASSVAAPVASGSQPKATMETTRFAVIGDFGNDTPGERDVAKLVRSWKPDFVVTTGDNNYFEGEASTIDAHIGKYYSEFIGSYHGAFGSGSPVNRFFPSPGNHDWGTDTLAPYIQYFSLPGNERYYDVDLGLVHLYALDSDPHEPDGTKATSVQGQWLRERLAASKSCYDVVYFHHPAYSSGPHGSSRYMRWPFREWGAEVVLTGHDHIYERLDIDGLPFFVNGLGGAEKYDFTPANAVPSSKFHTNANFGAMLVTARPDGISYQFWDITGKKVDELEVKKSCTPG